MHKFGSLTRTLGRPPVSRVSPILSFNAKQIINKNVIKPVVAIQPHRYASGKTKEEEIIARTEIMRAQAQLGGGPQRIEIQHKKVKIYLLYNETNYLYIFKYLY